ncbi:DMT family transporter [Thalassotalea sp. 1_MG-2023]|uniref:DMT family transporter n=1 Tax=Thalassotalea sp. 1_MG-2023 TaxID=3062680 RepID=UPI0026E17221|nr:DMT family transporter [Thalassotalea sp. 1_MG-2023]MDO6428800.1 DMT family transporter [Thalassotalea sp. 1_MG-2023]
MFNLILLALLAGSAIAIQAVINTKLALLLNNTLLATACAFFIAFISVLILYLFMGNTLKFNQLTQVPSLIWYTGGILSALGVGLLYYLIPKLGAGSLMSFALTSQLICAMLFSHFGWLSLPQKTMNLESTLGALLMIIGLILINWKTA